MRDAPLEHYGPQLPRQGVAAEMLSSRFALVYLFHPDALAAAVNVGGSAKVSISVAGDGLTPETVWPGAPAGSAGVGFAGARIEGAGSIAGAAETQAAALGGVYQAQAAAKTGAAQNPILGRLAHEIELFLENQAQNTPKLKPSGAPPGLPVSGRHSSTYAGSEFSRDN